MTKSPCYKCKKRTSTCHGTCEEYFKFVKENREEKEMIRKAKDADNDYNQCRRKLYR